MYQAIFKLDLVSGEMKGLYLPYAYHGLLCVVISILHIHTHTRTHGRSDNGTAQVSV